jgi:hypothetical protein
MPNLNVQVVNSRNNHVSGAKVFVLIHHNIMPDAWLEEYTNADGQADFDISRFTRVDVYVNGDLELEDISIAESPKGVTVSI